MKFDDWWSQLDPHTQGAYANSQDGGWSLGEAAFNTGLEQALLSFKQLSDKQQKFAVQWHYEGLLQRLAEGSISFRDPALTEGVARAQARCERLQTPWFLGEHIHDEVGDLVMQVAKTEAELVYYLNPQLDLDVANCIVPQD